MTNGGPLVSLFEREIEKFCGVAHAVCVANCTVGLQVLMRSLELKGEVIVPSYTFAATAQAVRWIGLEPVFCDVELGSRTMDVDRARSLITNRTSAILGVHMFGEQCDADELRGVVPHVIFDGAHAFGCTWSGTPAAKFGDACVFSFHATKHVSSFEGGVICTDDAILADRCRRLVTHGWDGKTFDADGTNAKMSEAHAACGIASLREEATTRSRNIAGLQQYDAMLESDDVRLVSFAGGPGNRRNGHYAQVEFSTAEMKERSALALAHAVIETRPYFRPLHLTMPGRRGPMPVTEDVASRGLCLPNGHLTADERAYVVETLLRSLDAH